MKKNFVPFAVSLIPFALGCGTSAPKPEASSASERETIAESIAKESQNSNLSEANVPKLLQELTNKIQLLEAKLVSMNDKLDATRQSVDRLAAPPKEKAETAASQSPSQVPSDDAGESVEAKTSPNDPELGFINDTAVQNFRKSMIFFQARNYPDAILSFSQFVENYPDHPLAGPAQFYVAESYFKQKEYKLALQEYQRVLTSYDKSSHVSESLGRMIVIEEGLKKTTESAKHRQLLTSLFPTSPATADLTQIKVSADKEEDEEPAQSKPEPVVKPSPTPTATESRTPTPIPSPHVPASKLDPVPITPVTAPIELKPQAASQAVTHETNKTE